MIFKINGSQRHTMQQQRSQVLTQQALVVAAEIESNGEAVTKFVEEITRQRVQVFVAEAVRSEFIAFESKHAHGLGRYKELVGLFPQVEALKVENKAQAQELQRLRDQDRAMTAALEELKKRNQTRDEEMKVIADNVASLKDAEVKRAEVAARRLRFDDCMRGSLVAAYTIGAAWLGAYLASFSFKC